MLRCDWQQNWGTTMAEHIARKRFGQHFLCDGDVITSIVRAIHPQVGDNLVEIGPGLGALTYPLLALLPFFHVIELDRDIVTRLTKRHLPTQLAIHAADALAFDFASLGTNLRIVGNLPYNISTPLLFRLAEFAPLIHDIHVMLQKEVVDRMTADIDSHAYGRLSVMLQYRYEMEALFDVPPEAFRPPPKVNSAVVRMVPRPREALTAIHTTRFEQVVASAFSQRRKTVRNSLSALMTDSDFTCLNIDPRRRAETLSVADFIQIANHLSSKETPCS
jgi:16S rRNA (adenine1518-N6/adenine1519-N6)-dimethyltransferase